MLKKRFYLTIKDTKHAYNEGVYMLPTSFAIKRLGFVFLSNVALLKSTKAFSTSLLKYVSSNFKSLNRFNVKI